MQVLGALDTRTLSLTIGSEHDRNRLSDLLREITTDGSVTLTIAPSTSAPAPSLPGGLARSFADAMREVEASYYNAA